MREQNQLANTYVQGEGHQPIQEHTFKYTQDSNKHNRNMKIYTKLSLKKLHGFALKNKKSTYLNIFIDKEIEEESVQSIITIQNKMKILS